MQYIILIDFDGTITTEDLAVKVLDRFTDADWQYYDELLDRQEIGLEECMQRQYGLIKTDKDTIIEYIAKITQSRPEFDKLVDFSQNNNAILAIKIVSAGLDFIISDYLQRNGIDIPIYAIETVFDQVEQNGIQLVFRKYEHPEAKNFKQDIIWNYQKQGYKVIFIGDGGSDFAAAEVADRVYAVEGRSLEQHCIKNNIDHIVFQKFDQVISDLKTKLVEN